MRLLYSILPELCQSQKSLIEQPSRYYTQAKRSLSFATTFSVFTRSHFDLTASRRDPKDLCLPGQEVGPHP